MFEKWNRIAELDYRVQVLFNKSRTRWLTSDELNELREASKEMRNLCKMCSSMADLADSIVQNQTDKLTGNKIWK